MVTKLNDFLPDASAPKTAMVTTGMQLTAEDYSLITEADIKQLLKPREPFSHKGTYGHALIIAGAPATMGAALLASKGCLYAGAGLTTASIPESGLVALNTSLPEVMFVERKVLADLESFKKYNAIAIGPGLAGSHDYGKSNIELLNILIDAKLALVIDADALNFVAGHKLTQSLTKNSILTPHMKEFDRLYGEQENWWTRLQTARIEAKKKGIVVVLKNQFTFVIDQEGLVYVNPTGDPAMAQGGMGDVLTGIITAYIAQGYAPKEAAILGCFVHGKAGNELAVSHVNVTASQVAIQIPVTVKGLLGKV